jgi:hypothetical protein
MCWIKDFSKKEINKQFIDFKSFFTIYVDYRL